MIYALVVAVALVAWIAATVIVGYPALIIGALAGVVLAFVWILALTGGETLLKGKDGAH
ncbi:MAG: hypothetical protein ABTQ29_13975 [Siculibacillus sp.]